MHVAAASDHAGFSLKEKVREYLGDLGHTAQTVSKRERHLRRLDKIDAIEAKCGLEAVNGRPTSSDCAM